MITMQQCMRILRDCTLFIQYSLPFFKRQTSSIWFHKTVLSFNITVACLFYFQTRVHAEDTDINCPGLALLFSIRISKIESRCLAAPYSGNSKLYFGAIVLLCVANQCAGLWRYRVCSYTSVQFIFKTSMPGLASWMSAPGLGVEKRVQ